MAAQDLHHRPVGGCVRERRREAQPVLLGIIFAGCLHVPDQCRRQAGEARPDRLNRDRLVAPDRDQRRVLQPGRGAVDDHRVPVDRGIALVQFDPPGLDPTDVSEPDHPLDAAQQVELPLGKRRCLRHGRRQRGVDPEHHPRGFHSHEEVIRGGGRACRLHDVGGHPDEHGGVGLDDRAVEHPRLAGPNPADRLRVDSVFEEPHAGVGCRLPGPDDHELPGCGFQPR